MLQWKPRLFVALAVLLLAVLALVGGLDASPLGNGYFLEW